MKVMNHLVYAIDSTITDEGYHMKSIIKGVKMINRYPINKT